MCAPFLHCPRFKNEQMRLRLIWGLATWKDRWIMVKPAFLEYYRFVRDRDSDTIRSNDVVVLFASKGMKMKSRSQDTGFYLSDTRSIAYT